MIVSPVATTMSEPSRRLVSALSGLAAPFSPTGELTTSDLPENLVAQFENAAVVGLGESSHGTREFFDLRARLTRLLVEEFGARAVAVEAAFHPLCLVDDLLADTEGDVRSLLADSDLYEQWQTDRVATFCEWLQSFNADRPPEDRVHVYGFDTTIVADATVGIESYLDRVGADVDASLRADLDTMRAGYDSDAERVAMLESAESVLSALKPMADARKSAWIAADSRRGYETFRHRLRLVAVQLDIHERDHEGRMARRDESMAKHVEWIADLTTGPVVLWGHNGHLNRGRHVLAEWDVNVTAMGQWLTERYGERYCAVGLETGGGAVAALNGATGEVETYPIPDPPAGSVPDVFRRVGDQPFWLSVSELHDDSTTREWLDGEPRLHYIWGGHPDGDSPVRYRRSDLGEFDALCFVRESSPYEQLG
jgi:erythromycin esterase